jgi:SAM-dependent methyltransferase
MATHQQIANITDEEMVERMVSSYPERFDEIFWDYFQQHLAPALGGDQPVILDIGCGPGLLLRDLGARYPTANLVGTDITRAMIDHALSRDYAGRVPVYHLHDISSDPIPLADNSVQLVSMNAVLHVLDDPLEVLAEVRRVLARDGLLLLQDWIRKPLPVYLERMMPENLDEEQYKKARSRFIALFNVHNRYTPEDWQWLLAQAGFCVQHQQELRSPHFRTFVCSVPR